MAVNILFAKNFLKSYRKRIAANETLSRRYAERMRMFINNPNHPLLHDHLLRGTKKGLRAFSVAGDIRVVYRRPKTDKKKNL